MTVRYLLTHRLRCMTVDVIQGRRVVVVGVVWRATPVVSNLISPGAV